MYKKIIILTLTTLTIALSSLHAGSGSFFAGFGIGTATGIIGSKMAHECPRSRYIEVHTVEPDISWLRNEIRLLKEEISLLEDENENLNLKLEKENREHRKESRKLKSIINEQEKTIDKLESKVYSSKKTSL
ncbi:MAG: hypothetical protein WDZ41_01560 [Candidatus Babeliales bacterium]